MSSGGRTSDRAFKLVCIGFSLLMLLSSLICRVGIFNSEARISALEKDINHAENEKRLLTARLESRLSLAELEKIATETIGMQHPQQEQIHYMG